MAPEPTSATPMLRPLRKNPFEYDAAACGGVLQTLKMIAVGLVLLLPRLLVFFFAGAVLYLTCLTVKLLKKCGKSHDEAGRVLPNRFPKATAIVQGCTRCMLWGLGFWWISTDMRASLSDVRSAPVVISNHTGFIEILYLAGFLQAPMVIGRQETIDDAWFLSTIAQIGQSIPVERDCIESRRWVADEILRRTRWRYEQPAELVKERGVFPPLVVFPEGTCTNGAAIIDFKAGAFLPGVPIAPIYIRYPYRHLDPTWPGPVNPVLLFLRLMCQVYNSMEVTCLPVIDPTDAERADPALYSGRAKATMAAVAQLPSTEHSFDDVGLFCRVQQRRLPVCVLDEVVVAKVAPLLPTPLPPPYKKASDFLKSCVDDFASVDRATWDTSNEAGRAAVAAAFRDLVLTKASELRPEPIVAVDDEARDVADAAIDADGRTMRRPDPVSPAQPRHNDAFQPPL